MDFAAKVTPSFSRRRGCGANYRWSRSTRRGGAERRVATTTTAVAGATKFGLARLSSRDQTPTEAAVSPLAMPENLDATMRLLYAACQGDAAGVENLLVQGVAVDNIDFDSRTALHIDACEGCREVVRLLLWWKANINARNRGKHGTTRRAIEGVKEEHKAHGDARSGGQHR